MPAAELAENGLKVNSELSIGTRNNLIYLARRVHGGKRLDRVIREKNLTLLRAIEEQPKQERFLVKFVHGARRLVNRIIDNMAQALTCPYSTYRQEEQLRFEVLRHQEQIDANDTLLANPTQ